MNRLKELQIEAEHLAGRELELHQTPDGKWVVLYMTFDTPNPPPTGKEPEEAWANFISWKKEKTPKALSDLPTSEADDRL